MQAVAALQVCADRLCWSVMLALLCMYIHERTAYKMQLAQCCTTLYSICQRQQKKQRQVVVASASRSALLRGRLCSTTNLSVDSRSVRREYFHQHDLHLCELVCPSCQLPVCKKVQTPVLLPEAINPTLMIATPIGSILIAVWVQGLNGVANSKLEKRFGDNYRHTEAEGSKLLIPYILWNNTKREFKSSQPASLSA